MKKLILLITFSISGLLSYAQWEIGFGPSFTGPIDRFIDSRYQNGWGFFGNVTTRNLLPGSEPHQVKIGFYFDGINAGVENYDILLADPLDEEGNLELSNGHNGQTFLLRYAYVMTPKMSIFLDGVVGHRKFYSNQTVGLRQYDENFQDDVTRVHTAHTIRYGAGFGTRYSIGKSFGIEIRAEYTRGNSATYFDLNATERDGNDVLYTSETWKYSDLYNVTVGLNFKLFKSNSTVNTSPSTPINSRTSNPNPNNYYPSSQPSGTERTTTPSSSSSSTPRKVTPKGEVKEKPVEEKKKREVINW